MIAMIDIDLLLIAIMMYEMQKLQQFDYFGG